jgi:tRNA 2-selenouridine synthase
LVERLRASPVVEIAAGPEARLEHLLREYAALGDDPQHLAQLIGLFKGLHANETLLQWQHWAEDGALRPLFAALMAEHYDPLYARSQRQNFAALAQARRFEADDLGAAGIAALAERIAAGAHSVQ